MSGIGPDCFARLAMTGIQGRAHHIGIVTRG